MRTKQAFLILGEPASKANSRRIVTIRGMARSIKSQKALNYVASFKLQATPEEIWEDDVRVTIHIYYASRRPDLDESVILDCLQDVAYRNDRQVKEKHIFWHLDRENPRAEIEVEKNKATRVEWLYRPRSMAWRLNSFAIKRCYHRVVCICKRCYGKFSLKSWSLNRLPGRFFFV
jgi:Holliday junction resolvase RusA-like endonuclease